METSSVVIPTSPSLLAPASRTAAGTTGNGGGGGGAAAAPAGGGSGAAAGERARQSTAFDMLSRVRLLPPLALSLDRFNDYYSFEKTLRTLTP